MVTPGPDDGNPTAGSLTLSSFDADMKIAVVGASGGIGHALTTILAKSPAVDEILACSRSGAVPSHPKIRPHRLDLEKEETIEEAARAASALGDDLDLVIVATGILHHEDGLRPEKTWRALDGTALERVFRVNTVGPALVAKHFLPLLARRRKSVFVALSARVGSISDNQLGGWHAYRASKAALNMLLRNFAIELARRNPRAVCVGLHPGTVDTQLSAPFQANVADDRLFTPAVVAARLLQVIDRLGADDSGRVFAWDGDRIPA